jgi:hypothetical protein
MSGTALRFPKCVTLISCCGQAGGIKELELAYYKEFFFVKCSDGGRYGRCISKIIFSCKLI